jgi:hypothetical protein
MLIGKEENILPIMNENITVTSNGYYKKIVTIKISNSGIVPLKLKYTGDYTFHSNGPVLEVPAKGELLVTVKTREILEKIEMPFEVLNIITAPKQKLKFNYCNLIFKIEFLENSIEPSSNFGFLNLICFFDEKPYCSDGIPI